MTKTTIIDIEALLAANVDATVAYINRRTKALEDRIRVLETRSMRYSGVFRHGNTYDVGSAVTDRGALWFANCATSARPGSSPDWTLCVKRGSAE